MSESEGIDPLRRHLSIASYIAPEAPVSANHPLRKIRQRARSARGVMTATRAGCRPPNCSILGLGMHPVIRRGMHLRPQKVRRVVGGCAARSSFNSATLDAILPTQLTYLQTC
jgi:hypothetical protein